MTCNKVVPFSAWLVSLSRCWGVGVTSMGSELSWPDLCALSCPPTCCHWWGPVWAGCIWGEGSLVFPSCRPRAPPKIHSRALLHNFHPLALVGHPRARG